MPVKVLLIDDDPNLLQGLRRQYHKRFKVICAEAGPKALEILKEHDDIGVVVSDMRMPQMTGLEVLKHIRTLNPNIVRIMLTGNADQQTAIDAVNEGAIFRFYNKPCDPETLAYGIDDALRQYDLVSAEKILLEKTLAGTIKFLVDLLSFSNPKAFARSARIREWIKQILPHFQLKAAWQLDFAAMLMPMSDLILPQEITDKIREGSKLSQEEADCYNNASKVIQDMLKQIPRLEEIADIIASIHLSANAETSDDLPIESRILRILDDLAKQTKRTKATEKIFKKMVPFLQDYDADVFHTIKSVLLDRDEDDLEEMETMKISLLALQPGYTLLSDITSTGGRLLLATGSVLSETHIEKLKLAKKHIENTDKIMIARSKKT
ncbi:MAG: response regulator [Terasakiella sp.]|uniref:response regulator n=1 Tax=unclassified Terasakiella TaxID=2614952 RepID=UPI003AFFD927